MPPFCLPCLVGFPVLLLTTFQLHAQDRPTPPPEILARLGIQEFRHDGTIMSLAYSPDGSRLATVGASLRVWDTASGRLLSEHWAKGQLSRSVAFSPDGKLVAVENFDSRSHSAIWVLDIKDDRYEQRTAYIERESGLAFSPDGALFVRGGVDVSRGLVTLWDVATGKQVNHFQKNTEDIQFIRFAANAPVLATQGRGLGSFGYPPRVWDMTLSRLLLEFPEDQLIAVAPDGKRVLTWTYGMPSKAQVRLWDIETKKVVWVRNDHNDFRFNYRFLSDDELLEVDYVGERLRCHALPSGKIKWSEPLPPKLDPSTFRLTLDHPAFICRDTVYHGLPGPVRKTVIPELGTAHSHFKASVSPDGATLAIAFNSLVRFFDLKTGTERTSDAGHRDEITSLAFFPDGQRIVSASKDGSVRLWDLNERKQAAKLYQGKTPARIVLTPDGKSLVVHDSGRISVLDPASGDVRRSWPAQLDVMVLSPDGELLAGRKQSAKTVLMWELATGEIRFKLALPKEEKWEATSLGFSPDGKILAFGGSDRQIHLADSTNGTIVRRIVQPGPSKEVPAPSAFMLPLVQVFPVMRSLAFSSDGLYLYWANNAGQLFRVLLAHPDGPARQIGARDHADGNIHLSPSGTTIVCPNHGMLLFIDPISAKLHHVFYRVETSGDSPLIFAPHDRRIAFGSGDARVHLLDPWHNSTPRKLSREDVENAHRFLSHDGEMLNHMKTLASSPETTVAVFKEKAKPIPHAHPEKTRGWLADLDNAAFAVREKAMAELMKLDDAILQELFDARKESKTLEAQRRIDKLLENSLSMSPEALRDARSIDILEAIGTPEAREVLRIWAGGPPHAKLTRQAAGAVRRLGREPKE